MDDYIFQSWNPVSETWTTDERPANATRWFHQDPHNRRVLDGDRRIIVQPED